ncbi:uncharacterized protein [Physcomitrium patens]|uniref:uncharacterized protein n=1 Tax=Physcomitrium patens TaxID=3218 RepID=UPI003CCE3D48
MGALRTLLHQSLTCLPREGGDTLGAIAHAAIALPYAAFTQPARVESTDVNVGDWDSHSAMLLRPCFSTMSFFDICEAVLVIIVDTVHGMVEGGITRQNVRLWFECLGFRVLSEE